MATQECACGCGASAEAGQWSFFAGHDTKFHWRVMRKLHGDGTEGTRNDTLIERHAKAYPAIVAAVREEMRGEVEAQGE